MDKRVARQRYIKGFTIVELLIVIVIIAILATITVVAYNGMTTRAENNKTTEAVANYGRALMMYATANGQYPTVGWYCLADNETTCGQMTGGSAATCFGLGGAGRSASFDSAVQTIISTLPMVSDQVMACGSATYQGVVVNGPDVKNLKVFALYRGSISCPTIGGYSFSYSQQQDEVTLCVFTLPTLP